MTNYYLQLHPLTPIHIGNGEEMPPYSYVVEEDKYYAIDLVLLIESLEKERQDKLLEAMEKGPIQLRQFIFNLKDIKGKIFRGRVSPKFESDYLSNIDQEENQLLVQEYIKTVDQPYIPGSSLKGALRTAYLHTFGTDIKFEVQKNEEGKIVVPGATHKAKAIESNNLKYINFFGDPFQTIYISDSYPRDYKLTVYRTELINIKKESTAIPVYQEVIGGEIDSNQSSLFEHELRIHSARQNYSADFNSVKLTITKDDLIRATKKFAKDLLDFECRTLRKYGLNSVLEVYKRLQEIYSNLGLNESLVRLGKGSGYSSVSLNLANEWGETETYSRSLGDGLYPFGWALIKVKEKNGSLYSFGKVDSQQDRTRRDKDGQEREESGQRRIRTEEEIKEDNKEIYPDVFTFILINYGEKEVKRAKRAKKRGKRLFKKYEERYNKLIGNDSD